MPTETYTSDGQFTVPTGVNEVDVTLYGSDGEDGSGDVNTTSGGDGRQVAGTLSVNDGDTLYVRFFEGGSGTSFEYLDGITYKTASSGSGGTGAVIRRNGTALSDTVAAAAGGGGGVAVDIENNNVSRGGNAGGDTGEPGILLEGFNAGEKHAQAGGGATQSGPGEGGANNPTRSGNGASGGDAESFDPDTAPGGGGSGYYGGGGGVSNENDTGAGGGGSSYTGGLSSVTTDSPYTGSPQVVIEYEAPPGTPSGLSAYATGSSGINLNWNAAARADSYRIYRSTSPGVNKGDTLVATSGDDFQSDNGLADGRRYHYRVSAVNSVGEGNLSNEAAATTNLPAPTNLSVDEVDEKSAVVSWNANHSNGNTEVQIRQDDSGAWSTVATVSNTVESETLTGLLNGQLYGVRVAADTEDAFEVDQ